MEEGNLNSSTSSSTDKTKNVDDIFDINEELAKDNNQEVLLNIVDEDNIIQDNEDISQDKKKFSLFWFLGKKEKTDSDEIIITEKQENNASDLEQDDIIVWEEKNSLNDNINIFQELWDLSFLDSQEKIQMKKIKSPLEIAFQISSYLFYVLLIFNFLFFLHTYIKSTDSEFVSYIPWACSYIWTNIENYDNSSECKTFPNIVADLSKNIESTEKNIINNLKVLIPSRLQIDYILATPEVKFILDKKSSENILYTKIISEFELIRKNSWWYSWKNIICSNYSFNEKWILSVSCDFLWWPILNELQSWDETSRSVALDFLKQLQLNWSFKVVNYPKSIEISSYNSVEWILTVFKTKSTLLLNLQYSLSSK